MTNNLVDDENADEDQPDDHRDSDALALRRIDPLAGDQSEYEDACMVARILGDPPPPPPRLAGRWVLLERLGSGGMGDVHAAYDLQFDCKVAIKFLRLHDGQDGEAARTRFLREGQAMRQIPRPANVVQVHDVSTQGEQTYLVMEYIQGPTLEKWQQDRALDDIVAAYRQAGAGLAAIHAAGLVHRDFKPTNALVTEGADIHVAVSDLGLAYATEPAAARPDGVDGESALHPASPLTATGTQLGTIHYMAPEQLRGEPADARSDQFAFCVSLYEALCGQRPFHLPRFTPAALLELMRRGMPAARQRHGKPLPARIEQVLRRGLSMEPADRFPDMQTLLAELEPRPRRAWPWVLAGVAALTATLAFLFLPREQPDPCMIAADTRQAIFWTPRTEQQLQDRRQGTPETAPERAWEALVQALRTGSRQWHEQFFVLCSKAPRQVLAETPAGSLAPAQECLRQNQRTLTQVSEASLATSSAMEPRALERLYDDALRVVTLRDCTEQDNWLAFSQSTPFPLAEGELVSLGQKLTRLEQLARAAKYDEARTLAREAMQDMQALSNNPMLAEPMFRLGEVLTYVDAHEEAAPLLDQAADLAATYHLHALASDIWLYRLKHVLVDLDDTDLARRFTAVAEHAMLQAGKPTGDTIRRAEYEEVLGLLASREEEYDVAAGHHEEALRIRRALTERLAENPNLVDILQAKSLNNLANVRRAQKRYKEAVEFYEDALALRETTLGADHPDVGQVFYNLGLTATLQADYPLAIDHLSRALAIEEKRAPPRLETLLSRHLAIATAAVSAHVVDETEGRHEDAAKHLELATLHATSIVTLQQRLAADDPAAMQERARIEEHVLLANIHALRENVAGGLERLEAALRIRERERDPCTCGERQAEYRDDLVSAAYLLCELNRSAEARAYLEKALKPPVSCSTDNTPEIHKRIQEEITRSACRP